MIVVFFAGAFLVLFFWLRYYRRHWCDKLSVDLKFDRDYTYAGNTAVLREVIENRKRLSLPVLELSFQIAKGITFEEMENVRVSDFVYKRDIFSFLGWQRIIRELMACCEKRGYYRVEQTMLKSYSIFFDEQYLMKQETETGIYVYPKRTDVSRLLVQCEKMLGDMECEKRLFEDPFAFASIRNYVNGDAMKQINWRATAKTGELMVNTYASALSRRVMIYLDMEDKGILTKEYLLEESISIAASMAEQLLKGGMEVALRVNEKTEEYPDGIYIDMTNDRNQRDKIERILARLVLWENTFSFSDMFRPISQECIAVFISKNVKENENAIAEFIGKDKYALWIVPMGADDAAEQSVKMTSKNLGIEIRKVERG